MVEHQFVTLNAVGSIPAIRPKYLINKHIMFLVVAWNGDLTLSVGQLPESFVLPEVGHDLELSHELHHEVVTLEGVGFQCEVQCNVECKVDTLHLKVGFVKVIVLCIPPTIEVVTGRMHGSPAIFMSSRDSQALGTFSNAVCQSKPQSVYKKRGIATLQKWLLPRKVVKGK